MKQDVENNSEIRAQANQLAQSQARAVRCCSRDVRIVKQDAKNAQRNQRAGASDSTEESKGRLVAQFGEPGREADSRERSRRVSCLVKGGRLLLGRLKLGLA